MELRGQAGTALEMPRGNVCIIMQDVVIMEDQQETSNWNRQTRLKVVVMGRDRKTAENTSDKSSLVSVQGHPHVPWIASLSWVQ